MHLISPYTFKNSALCRQIWEIITQFVNVTHILFIYAYYNLVISAHSHRQVAHILPQLPSGGVDLHRSDRDRLSLSELQVLHFSQYGCKLAKGVKKMEAMYKK